MNPIYAKIIDSDVIIFGTPVYWYGPTALMKLFIARFVYFNCPENRDKIIGEKAIIAVPFEEDKPETTVLLISFFKKCFEYLQMQLAAKLIVGGVTRKGDILKKKDRIAEAYALGKKLAL